MIDFKEFRIYSDNKKAAEIFADEIKIRTLTEPVF